ncbi:hypothetical protein [Desulfovibrio sp. DV]|uniref:hypothetical protein n=1 Tax=Desulfovibrio sp. DV TaxID=1844708 RepID=UPI0034C6867D
MCRQPGHGIFHGHQFLGHGPRFDIGQRRGRRFRRRRRRRRGRRLVAAAERLARLLVSAPGPPVD